MLDRLTGAEQASFSGNQLGVQEEHDKNVLIQTSLERIKAMLKREMDRTITKKTASDITELARDYSTSKGQELEDKVKSKMQEQLQQWTSELTKAKIEGQQEKEPFGNIDIALQAINQLRLNLYKQNS